MEYHLTKKKLMCDKVILSLLTSERERAGKMFNSAFIKSAFTMGKNN